MNRIKLFLKGDISKSLFQQSLFWITFIIISFSALAVSLVIFIDQNLYWSPTYKGILGFVSHFKVPIYIFGINVPALALVTSYFRSAQSGVQISLMREQNIFNNHFKHIEEFEKYISKSPYSEMFFISYINETHSILFPHTKTGNYSLGKELVARFDEYFKNIHERSTLMSQKEGLANISSDLIFILRFIEKMEGDLFLRLKFESFKFRALLEGVEYPANGSNLSNLLAVMNIRMKIIIHILHFDGMFQLPENIVLCNKNYLSVDGRDPIIANVDQIDQKKSDKVKVAWISIPLIID
jgi:hypothetical protein